MRILLSKSSSVQYSIHIYSTFKTENGLFFQKSPLFVRVLLRIIKRVRKTKKHKNKYKNSCVENFSTIGIMLHKIDLWCGSAESTVLGKLDPGCKCHYKI